MLGAGAPTPLHDPALPPAPLASSPARAITIFAQSEVAPSWVHPEQWFQTNAVAIAALGNYLKDQRWLERYVHISSPEVYGTCEGVVTEDAPLDPTTPYAASKAAVIHLTKSTAIELAEHDIRVNCLAPAHIATPINAFYDVSEIVARMQPLQRQGRPNDVAEAALFLASERAAQITGVVLPVDGGTTAGPPAREANAIAAAAMKDVER